MKNKQIDKTFWFYGKIQTFQLIHIFACHTIIKIAISINTPVRNLYLAKGYMLYLLKGQIRIILRSFFH